MPLQALNRAQWTHPDNRFYYYQIHDSLHRHNSTPTTSIVFYLLAQYLALFRTAIQKFIGLIISNKE